MSESTEKLNDLLPLSPDHNAERLAELKRLFPDLFSNEGRLNVDEFKKVVDPKLLSETERYDFRWYGKTASKREAFTPSRAALVCDKARSFNPDKAAGNMIIEGENLEVLKLLSSAYRERVKCIYIDPPYNTGKDFVYSDRFAEGQKPYWEQTGVTEEGVKVDTNTDSDGRFHSKWLSMMHSRLLIARYLLRPDGLVFVSIDDNEVQNLRRVMDEVFGEENFVDTIIWKKRYGGGAKEKHLVSLHEYVLVYSRDIEALPEIFIPLHPDSIERYYTLKDDKFAVRGGYRTHPLEATKSMGDRPNLVFPIPGPDGKNILPKRQWLWGKERVDQAIKDGELSFQKDADGNWSVHTKQYLKDEEGVMRQGKAFSVVDDVYTQHGTNEIIELFGDAQIFSFPKPTAFLLKLLDVALDNGGGIVLDFFAGSGSLPHALMLFNRLRSVDYKFIAVQLPEFTATDSPAHKAGLKRISDITIERTKRVIARIQKDAEGLLPNDPQRQSADELGFKVYKLGKSHFPRVEFAPDPDKSEAENIELLKQYIRDKEATFHVQWERETVLDEVLLKNGFMLDYTLTPRPEFTKNEVFLAKDAHKESLICLDATIDEATVDHFKKHPEPFFICLELALDTTKKWNLKHHLGDKLKAF